MKALSRCLLLLLIACGGGTGVDGGTDAGGNGGGSAGGGGTGGGGTAGGGSPGGGSATGGSGGNQEPCLPIGNATSAASVQTADGGLQSTPVTATVSVVSTTTTGFQTELVLDGGTAGWWTVKLQAHSIPAALFTVSEALQLDVGVSVDMSTFASSLNQTVALSRSGELIAFGAQIDSRFPSPPDFSSHRLVVTAAGQVCESYKLSLGCGTRLYQAGLSFDGGSPVIAQIGVPLNVGPFLVTLGDFRGVIDTGFCDGKGSLRLTGFRY